MKPLKLFFLFLFILILIPTIYSASLDSFTCNEIFFNDSFIVNTTYASRGYNEVGLNCGNFPSNPPNTSFSKLNATLDGFAFGHKTSNIVCGATHPYTIRKPLPTNISVGSNRIVLAYELAEQTAIDGFSFSLNTGLFQNVQVLGGRNFYDPISDRTSIFNNIGGESCDMTTASDLEPPYSNMQFILDINIDAGTYSAFYKNLTDGTSDSFGCDNKILGSFTGINAIQFGILGKAQPAGMEAYIDDITLCEATVTLSGVENATVDLAVAVSTVWNDMGLRSSASKNIFAMGMLIVINLVIVGFAMSKGIQISIGALTILNLLIMILFVIVQILPIWIPVVLALVGGGIGAIAIKRNSES